MRGYCGVGGGITKGLLGLGDNQRELLFWAVCIPIRTLVLPAVIHRLDWELLSRPLTWACLAHFVQYRLQEIDWKQQKNRGDGRNRPSFLNPMSYSFNCQERASHAQLSQFAMVAFSFLSFFGHDDINFLVLGSAWIVFDALMGAYWRCHSP